MGLARGRDHKPAVAFSVSSPEPPGLEGTTSTSSSCPSETDASFSPISDSSKSPKSESGNADGGSLHPRTVTISLFASISTSGKEFEILSSSLPSFVDLTWNESEVGDGGRGIIAGSTTPPSSCMRPNESELPFKGEGGSGTSSGFCIVDVVRVGGVTFLAPTKEAKGAGDGGNGTIAASLTSSSLSRSSRMAILVGRVSEADLPFLLDVDVDVDREMDVAVELEVECEGAGESEVE